MYKVIIFDLDGVLIETEGIHIRAITQTFADKDYKLDDEEIKSLIGRAPIEYVPELAKKHGWNIGELSDFINSFRENFHPIWEEEVLPKPNVIETLELLKQKGVRVDLATNSSAKTVNKFISKFELENIFTNITTGDEVKKRKPDPEIYLIAKGKAGVADHEILAVEDSSVGLNSAKQAGLRVAVVPNSYTNNQNFSEADYKLKIILEVVDLIKDK